jgi:hypothetical protein
MPEHVGRQRLLKLTELSSATDTQDDRQKWNRHEEGSERGERIKI